MLLQSWFMYGGVVGVSLLIALHLIVTVSMILEGWKKYVYMAFILMIITGLFVVELVLPDIVRPYAEPRYMLIDVFLFLILIGGGIVVCVVLVMQNHQIQYERINQFNTSLDQSKKELEEKVKEQKEARKIIQKALREKELLLREIHHRVKNNLQVISSMLLLQQNKLENQETIEALNTAGSRVQSIALVHDLLYLSETIAHIDFQSYAEKLVYYLSNMYQRDKSVAIEVDTKDVVLSIEDAIACGLIVTELVSNSLKYAFPEKSSGRIEICLTVFDGYRYEMCVFDDGIGFNDNLQWETSPTLGLLLVQELVEGQLDGAIQLERSSGTFWRINWTTQPPTNHMGLEDEGF